MRNTIKLIGLLAATALLGATAQADDERRGYRDSPRYSDYGDHARDRAHDRRHKVHKAKKKYRRALRRQANRHYYAHHYNDHHRHTRYDYAIRNRDRGYCPY